MNSCLYECTVMHRRLQPKVHQFSYRVFMFWLDLDELDEIAREVPIFSSNESNLYSLNEEDHFAFKPGSLRANVIAWLQNQGETRGVGRVCMLTLPRFLGYTFNPITIYVIHDLVGHPIHSVVEVGNTFREYKPYSVPMEGEGFHARHVKNYYVSPFSELDLEFDFRFDLPDERLRVWIDDYRGEERELISTLFGERVPLTLPNLLWLTVKYPFITLRVIGLIHWEAFRLWWKKVPFYFKEADPDLQKDVFNPHGSIKSSAVESKKSD